MSVLSNIGSLVERVACNIEAVIDDRENLLAEISSLRTRFMERDKEAVKAAQDMMIELEAVRIDALRFEQERVRAETRLQCLNDRLIALVRGKQDNQGNKKYFGG